MHLFLVKTRKRPLKIKSKTARNAKFPGVGVGRPVFVIAPKIEVYPEYLKNIANT